MSSTVTISWRNPAADPNLTSVAVWRATDTTFTDATQVSPLLYGSPGQYMSWDDTSGLLGGPFFWWVQAEDSQGQTSLAGPVSLSNITGYDACGGTVSPLAVLDFKNGVYWNGLLNLTLAQVLSNVSPVVSGHGLNLFYFNPSPGTYGIFPNNPPYNLLMIDPTITSIFASRNYSMLMKFRLTGDGDSYMNYAFIQFDNAAGTYSAQIGLATYGAPAGDFVMTVDEGGAGYGGSTPAVPATDISIYGIATVTTSGNDSAYVNGSAPVLNSTGIGGAQTIDTVNFSCQYTASGGPAYLEEIVLYPILADSCAATATTAPAALAPPVFTSSNYPAGGNPTVNWSNPSWAGTGVTLDHLRVFRNTVQNFATATDVSGSLSPTTTTFTDSGATTAATVYYWWVAAYNSGESQFSVTPHKAVAWTVNMPSANYTYAGNANLIVTNSVSLSDFPPGRSDGYMRQTGYSYSGTITGGGSPWQLTLSGDTYCP